jgi:hypothetical protein
MNAGVVIKRLLIVVGLVLLGLGVLFVFLPVPVQQEGLLGPVFCGPGTSSDPAIIVWAHPSVTVEAGNGVGASNNQSQNEYVEGVCSNAAGGRLLLALGLGLGGLLAMVLGAWAVPYVLTGETPKRSKMDGYRRSPFD